MNCKVCDIECSGKCCSGKCRATLSRRTRTPDNGAHAVSARTERTFTSRELQDMGCIAPRANPDRLVEGYHTAAQLAAMNTGGVEYLNRVSIPGDYDYDGILQDKVERRPAPEEALKETG